MTKKSTGVGEALRAGEAKVQDIAQIAWTCIRECKDHQPPPVLCVKHQLEAEALAASDATERDTRLRERLEQLRPDAHTQGHLSVEDSYQVLAEVFGHVQDAHLAISRSDLRVRGITIYERVESLIQRCLLASPRASAATDSEKDWKKREWELETENRELKARLEVAREAYEAGKLSSPSPAPPSKEKA